MGLGRDTVRRSLVSAGAALCLLTLGLTPGAAAAAEPNADCTMTYASSSMDPANVVVGVSASRTSTFKVVMNNTCANPSFNIALASVDVVVGRTFDSATVVQGNGTVTYTGTATWNPAQLDNDHYAGSWISYIDASSDDGPSVSRFGAEFNVQRASTLSLRSSAASVTKGGAVNLSGALRWADWDAKDYRAHGGQRVRLEFRPTGGSYQLVESARSMSTGAVLVSDTPAVDGCYRLAYAGSARSAPVESAASCVNVI
jgi:hypothetical protein